MQLVQIAGCLGADAKKRTTKLGTCVVNLKVAVHIFKKPKLNKYKKVTIWWEVSVWSDRWGDRFDKMMDYLKKGSLIIAIGDMREPETYKPKHGGVDIFLSLAANELRVSPSKAMQAEGVKDEYIDFSSTLNPPFKKIERKLTLAGATSA